MATVFDPKRLALAKRAVTALRFDDDEYRTRAAQAELEELAKTAEYARHIIECGDPECDEAIEALEQGWYSRRL